MYDLYTVFGWMRLQRFAMSLQTMSLETYLILLYYHWRDNFDRVRTDFHKISKDGMAVSNIKYASTISHSIFMREWIYSLSDNIVSWCFDLSKCKDIVIGLVSYEEDIYGDFSMHGRSPYYAIMTNKNYSCIYINKSVDRLDEHISIIGMNDVIFILDLKRGTFGYKIGMTGMYNVLFIDIDQDVEIRYQLAIQSRHPSNVITLQ